MKFTVITLFPNLMESFSQVGVFAQSLKRGATQLELVNPRSFTQDNHKTVDDKTYGGGDGMILKVEPLSQAIESVLEKATRRDRCRVIYLSPQGTLLTSKKSAELASRYDQLVLLCGRYGGVDQRLLDTQVDEEISIGDYVLSGGELAASVLIEAVSRFCPGVLGHESSAQSDSFNSGLLEAPQYTRPAVWRGQAVPEVLLSGDHKKIQEFNYQESLRITRKKRPDLLSSNPEENSKKAQPLQTKISLALVHYPILDREKKVVATNVTNFDIHDIARACTVYGVDQYYIVHPLREQMMFVDRILDHWRTGFGSKFNPYRKKALHSVTPVENIEQLKKHWGQEQPLVIATHARPVPGVKSWSCEELHQHLRTSGARPLLLVFGTGFGLTEEFMQSCDGVLEPLRGAPPVDFRHLSVRSAVSIYLDRILGPW